MTLFHLHQTGIYQSLLSREQYCKAVEEENRKISKRHSNSVKHGTVIFKTGMLYIAVLMIFVVEIIFQLL